ncbi:MAG: hypothetical protein HY286_16250 [Planctomycetes bacterium]|nr:hypothetical protein [Planctomycetota bacterium]
MNANRVFAGIDEAGLGPLFGPLCIGFVILELPPGDEMPRRSLRGACAGAESKLTKRDPRVRVCDSKLLHRGAHKFEQLERTALAFLSAARGGKDNLTIRDVLAAVTPEAVLVEHPWYRDLDAALPIAADAGAVRRSRDRILRTCAAQKIKIAGIGARVIPEFELNALFDKTNNKSVALFESTAPLLYRAAEFADREPVVVCDRHGARASYAPLLSKAFDGSWVRIVREAKRESLYSIKTDGGRVRVVFAEKGERRSFTCALASCIAKYARELAMNRWNRYFITIAPGVRPTAGYYTDARRYLAEAGGSLRAAGIDPRSLMRNR